ncbi:MAG TPA: glutaminyl-peptide cyclotransferase [Saprospiraceae bacterium]|nr:glutaminyl-peptide cyclotransferase [Saprospiraceae bacterium]
MKKYKNFILILLVASVLAYILFPILKPNTPKRTLRYSEVIESPTLNALIPYGNSVEIKLVEETIAKYDSVTIQIDEQIVKYSSNLSLKINSKDLLLGSKAGIVNLWKNGKVTEIGMPINIISDYMPNVTNIIKIRKINKDPKAYTQGLEFYKGVLYESGGQYGESILRKINHNTGQIIKSVAIDKNYFAEGLTILNDKIYLLTWKEREILIYDLELNLIDKKPLNTTTGEGWGICNDGNYLIVSDGSHQLNYINPQTFLVEKVIEVFGGNKAARYLNELEYANGNIYANIYTTNQIVVIEPHSGRILNIPELQSIANENKDGEVLNGIAFNPESKTFYVTGKYWKNLYEIKM